MNWLSRIFAMGVVLGAESMAARAEPPATQPVPGNAALQYWQAFALLPAATEMDKVADASVEDPKTKELAASLESAVHYLHRGAQMERCDWGLAYDEGLFSCFMAHLGKARLLTQAGLLSAKVAWHEGHPEQAVSTVVDVMEFGRDVATDRMFISRLVSIGIESAAEAEAAHHVPSMPPQVIRSLVVRTQGLRPMPTLSEALLFEKRMALITLRQCAKPDAAATARVNQSLTPEQQAQFAELAKDPEEMRSLEQAFDDLARRASAPAGSAAPTTRPTTGRLADTLLPAYDNIANTDLRARVTRALFQAGLAVALDGEGALKQFPDPSDGAEFGYRKTSGGFILSSRLTKNGKPISMNFGAE